MFLLGLHLHGSAGCCPRCRVLRCRVTLVLDPCFSELLLCKVTEASVQVYSPRKCPLLLTTTLRQLKTKFLAWNLSHSYVDFIPDPSGAAPLSSGRVFPAQPPRGSTANPAGRESRSLIPVDFLFLLTSGLWGFPFSDPPTMHLKRLLRSGVFSSNVAGLPCCQPCLDFSHHYTFELLYQKVASFPHPPTALLTTGPIFLLVQTVRSCQATVQLTLVNNSLYSFVTFWVPVRIY